MHIMRIMGTVALTLHECGFVLFFSSFFYFEVRLSSAREVKRKMEEKSFRSQTEIPQPSVLV